MKKLKHIIDNGIYLLRLMRSCSVKTFYLMLIQIPVKVLFPFLGILLSQMVVRVLTESGDPQELIAGIVIIGGLLITGGVLDQYTAGSLQIMMSMVQSGLEERIMENEITADYEELEQKSKSGIFEEAMDYIWRNNSFIPRSAENMVELFSGLFGFLLYAVVLSELHIGILMIIIGTTLVSFLFADLGAKERRKMGWNIATRYITKLHEVSSQPKAGKDIRLYRMGSWFEEKFQDYLTQSRRNFHGKIARKNFKSGWIDAVMRVVRDGVSYGYLIWILYQRRIGAADFVLMTGAVAGFSEWVTKIAVQLANTGQMSAEISVIRECLKEKRSGEETIPSADWKLELDEIVFDHVFYRYPGSDRYVLRDISFTVKKGEKLALVGMNGAGKTTCVKLLCGLFAPTAGRILVNGRDVSEYGRREYYRLFSTVFQDSAVLPVSIMENVAQNRESIDADRVKDCIEKAGLKQKVESLPQGYDTLLVPELNSSGITLSGGQMQRVMLARAIYKGASALILDEPTVALDPIAENRIYMEYNRLVNGKISVFISHRLASTHFCDNILLLQNGEIREAGTHEELMAINGEYARMFALQSYYYQENMG